MCLKIRKKCPFELRVKEDTSNTIPTHDKETKFSSNYIYLGPASISISQERTRHPTKSLIKFHFALQEPPKADYKDKLLWRLFATRWEILRSDSSDQWRRFNLAYDVKDPLSRKIDFVSFSASFYFKWRLSTILAKIAN